ncbi:MAG: SAM-dependent methyltransferase [Chloroflexi bacterium]|nr:SAM-dependent methyltransferase [Chloroflexota bacterium]
MERALTEPGLGYYATSADRPTRAGDFLTAPELHPFFGRCIARWLDRTWTSMGRPQRFAVREHGAGRGTLASTSLEGLRAEGSGSADLVEWQPVDVPGRHPEPGTGPFTGVVLANEYLDALPVHRLVQRDGVLRECFVTWRDGAFAWVEGAPSRPDLDASIRRAGVTLAEGQLVEVRPTVGAWLRALAAELRHGVLLVIDYGHPAVELYGPRRMGGSLVTYRGHTAADDPLRWVGQQDITTHVDLSDLDHHARAAGLTPLGRTTQARFLAALGLGELLADLGRRPDTEIPAYLAARAAVARLLDPRHLGGFAVVAYGIGMPADATLPGVPDADPTLADGAGADPTPAGTTGADATLAGAAGGDPRG